MTQTEYKIHYYNVNWLIGAYIIFACYFKDDDIIIGKYQDDVWTDWMNFQTPTSENYRNYLVQVSSYY